MQRARRQPSPLLSWVIPLGGVCSHALLTVQRMADAFGTLDYELIFVDDGADSGDGNDAREALALELAANPRTHLLRPPTEKHEQGRAAALMAGILQARGAYIGVLDDRPQNVETLRRMVGALADADLVIASRALPGACIADVAESTRLSGRLASQARKLAASALFTRVRASSDPLSGTFLFRREVLDGIALAPTGNELLLELLVRGSWSRLTEIPACTDEDVPDGTVTSTSSTTSMPAYLAHLGDLRLHGPRGRGAIRYRYQRVPVGPDDPQPLDDELPDDPEIAGKRRRHLLWTIALLALALRIILLPIGHAWDLTVDYNVFIDLAHNHSPYETMRYLSNIAQSAGWDSTYEYYAYPPVPLYIYYPLAHIFALIHPSATYVIPRSGSFAMPSAPLDFFFWFKLPIWIADFAIAALLARMSGTIRGFRDYLLNPYVLLVSGAWTFDAIMVLGLVLGAYWLQRGKLTRSAIAMAFGTMIKFFPIIVVPTFLLFLIKKKRPVREIVVFIAVYGVACAVMLGPFLQGLLYVLNFHSGRGGGGMNWEEPWRLARLFPPGTNKEPMTLALAAFGTPALAIALMLAYWYGFTRRMSFNRMILVTLLAFFVGSKLVNEQYALMAFPFAFIEARRVGGAWRWLYRLLWIVPLVFAIMHVPIDHFLWLLYHIVFPDSANVIAVRGLTGFEAPFIPWQNPMLDQVSVAALGVLFTLLSLVALLWPVRPPRRPVRHAPIPAYTPDGASNSEASTRELAEPSAAGTGSGHNPTGGDTTPFPKVAIQT